MTLDNSAPLSGMSVLDSFEKIGSWEVPGFRHRQCGVVSHDRNETALRVVCIPEEGDDIKAHVDRSWYCVATIRGIAETGEHVVLDECFEHKAITIPITAPGGHRQAWTGSGEEGEEVKKGSPSIIIKSEYTVKRMYASEAPIPDKPTFSSMKASFTDLYSWLDHHTIDADLGKPDTVTITFSPPRDQKVLIGDDLTLELRHGYSMPLRPEREEFKLSRKASVEFSTSRECEPGWLYESARRFANFMMMGSAYPVQPETLQGRAGDRRCSIFPNYTTYEYAGSRGRRSMYFTYQQARDRFEEVVAGWYGMYERYGVSMDIYFRTRLEWGNLTAEAGFLRIMQALEAFYRARYPDREVKLEEMLTALAGESGGIIGGDEEGRRFASEAANARNSLSHGFLQKRQEYIPNGHEFLRMTARAEMLAYGCYLGLMALDEEVKRGIVSRRREEEEGVRYW